MPFAVVAGAGGSFLRILCILFVAATACGSTYVTTQVWHSLYLGFIIIYFIYLLCILFVAATACGSTYVTTQV